MMADRNKISQALLNVLSNAYKYSPADSSVQIRIKQAVAFNNQPMVGILVTDAGIGMTQEQSSRMFERFYRADFSGKVPGTGLGMAIVKEIMDLHNGFIEVQSKPGLGTAICLLLPVATERESP